MYVSSYMPSRVAAIVLRTKSDELQAGMQLENKCLRGRRRIRGTDFHISFDIKSPTMEGQYQERRQAQSINHLPEARSNRILGSISQPIRGQIESLSGSMPTLYSDTDFGFEFWTCMGYIFPLRMGAFSGQDGSTFPPRPGSLFPPGLVHFSPPAWVHFFSIFHRNLFQFAGQNGAHFSKPKTASVSLGAPSPLKAPFDGDPYVKLPKRAWL